MNPVWIVLLVLVVVFIKKSIYIVPQSECLIIERLGRFSRILTSGFNIVIPFIEVPRAIFWIANGRAFLQNRIDLRETVMDVPEQAVITRDNVSINIDALLYVQVTDPIKATYEISNLPQAVAQLAQTSLRNVIGEMDLDHTLASRDVINSKLKVVLDEACDKWGTKVNRVELKNITPPREIQLAMEKQMQAERERRAKVLEAEGDKQAKIARSEGDQRMQINLAQGDREATVARAEGEAAAVAKIAAAKKEAIQSIREAMGSGDAAAQYLIATQYLDTFKEFSTKPGDKIYIPYEASTALSQVGAIRDLIAGNVSGQKSAK